MATHAREPELGYDVEIITPWDVDGLRSLAASEGSLRVTAWPISAAQSIGGRWQLTAQAANMGAKVHEEAELAKVVLHPAEGWSPRVLEVARHLGEFVDVWVDGAVRNVQADVQDASTRMFLEYDSGDARLETLYGLTPPPAA